MKYFFLFISVLFVSGCSKNTSDQSSTVSSSFKENTEQAIVTSPPLSSFLTPEQMDTYAGEYYLPVFMFHYIENIPENTSDQIRYQLSFSPEKLESFLLYFQENNIQTLTFYDIASYIEKNEPLPKNSVILTFDDGHNDHYTDVFKLLEKYNMKGVFYIISDKPDNDSEYMTWSQIQEISNAGHEIGSHTKTHRDLRSLNQYEKEEEILGSKETIEQYIEKKIISFCYPAGKYNADDLLILKDAFLFARTTQNGKTLSFTGAKKYILPTVRIFPTTGTASLRYWFLEE